MPIIAGGFDELPNVGTIVYNGVEFDPLHTSQVSCKPVYDTAGRTVKWVEYTITVDATITLTGSAKTTDALFAKLRSLLSAPGGVFDYSGNGLGNPFIVNAPGSPIRDVQWGPKPQVLEFVPLGASRSAKVRWTVTTCIPELRPVAIKPVLEFCFSIHLGYDENRYSQIGISGTLEIPLTRNTVGDRNTSVTVDQFREEYIGRITAGFDLTRFKPEPFTFDVSEDKRVLRFDLRYKEHGPMCNPEGVITARGTFKCRNNSKTGGSGGLVNWLCTLHCTYVVPKNKPQRLAWAAFLGLLLDRMRYSTYGELPPPDSAPNGFFNNLNAYQNSQGMSATGSGFAMYYLNGPPPRPVEQRRPFLLSFDFDEGLYEDSPTVSFSATWRLITSFRSILVATGWRQFQNKPTSICNPARWAKSVASVCGPNSWLTNDMNPAAQVIVDFGSS